LKDLGLEWSRPADELGPVARKLARDGLYVMVSDKFLESEDAYRDLLTRAWP
jgi:hypothetical protein